jgi:photosystem II stability/assembly factor-like uncharacterized protein
MKKFLLSIILIIFGTLSGCNSQSKTISHNQPTWSKGEQIAVNGVSNSLTFQSIDFIDDNTGWVIGNGYNLEKQGSRILHTEDAGKNWSEITVKGMTLERLMFIDKTTGWAIARTENKNTLGVSESTMKILHTQDGGKSFDIQWEDKLEFSPDNKIWFENTNNGYALLSGTLLSTKDGGKQWSKILFNIDGFTPQHMSYTNFSTGWVIGVIDEAGSSKSSDQNSQFKNKLLSVLRTTDEGKHWQQQFKKIYTGSIDIDFVNAKTGWFLTSDMDTLNGDLYYTSSAGADWQKINQVRSLRPSPTELHFITPKVGWIPLDMGAGPISGGLMYTQDGGKSFRVIDNDGRANNMSEVYFTSIQQGWAIGILPNYGDYIIHTTDGGKTWAQVSPQIGPTEDISFVDSTHGFGLGKHSNFGALLYTEDAGDTWKDVFDFSRNFNISKISFINSSTGWVTASDITSQLLDNTVILKTKDGGKTWAKIEGTAPMLPAYSIDYFKFFNEKNGIMFSDFKGLYNTSDGGNTWNLMVPHDSSQTSNQYSFVSPELAWKTNLSGKDQIIDLDQTKDGSNWQPLPRVSSNLWCYGITFTSKDIGYMLVDDPPFKPNSLVKLLVTSDGGHTWSSYSFPHGFKLDTLGRQIPMQFTDSKHGWILSIYGLLSTQDGGATWNYKQDNPN